MRPVAEAAEEFPNREAVWNEIYIKEITNHKRKSAPKWRWKWKSVQVWRKKERVCGYVCHVYVIVALPSRKNPTEEKKPVLVFRRRDKK